MKIIPYAVFIFIFLFSCTSLDKGIKGKEYNSELGMISSEKANEDIKYLFERLEKSHYNPYLHVSKEQLAVKIDSVTGSWKQRDSIQKSEYLIGTMTLISQTEDAHAGIRWYSKDVLPQRDSIGYLPIQAYFNGKNELHSRNASFKNQINEEIISINGLDAKSLYREALNCLPGVFEYNNEMASDFFFPAYLYLRGVTAPYTIELKSKIKVQIKKSELFGFMDLYRTLIPSKSNYEYKLLEKENIGLLNYNSCNNRKAFKVFLDSTFSQIKKEGIKDLIIDIRNNMGGNSSVSNFLMDYITEKQYRQSSKRVWKISDASIKDISSRGYEKRYGDDFIDKYRTKKDSTILDFGTETTLRTPQKVENHFYGKTYVLTGAKTFSSANMLADAISTYDLSTLVGKPTGQRTTDFAEQKSDLLPNSKFPFTFTVVYAIGADGDASNTKTVNPDIFVDGDALEYTVDLILKNRDNTK
ncbi:MAG: hypothetical protein HRT66_08285 [Flavobacteriaceae bacterium]|nr:hypothetical protein [Flavobacteriaceae bacterium]